MDSNKRPETMARITTKELAEAFIAEQVAEVRRTVGDKKVLLALSGGVDSSVVAALLIKAIGKQLVCVHVNHGLMRKNESENVITVFRGELDANLIYVDATDRFLDLLAGVSDPEKKRKIIGAEFINVFVDEARKLEGIEFLAQGTIYPDPRATSLCIAQLHFRLGENFTKKRSMAYEKLLTVFLHCSLHPIVTVRCLLDCRELEERCRFLRGYLHPCCLRYR